MLDATKCISYLTIEAKGEIPAEFHEAIGELIYGCDICQDVCPWNEKFAHELPEGSRVRGARGDRGEGCAHSSRRELLAMSQEEFSARSRIRR